MAYILSRATFRRIALESPSEPLPHRSEPVMPNTPRKKATTKKTSSTKTADTKQGHSASRMIDERIKERGGGRGEMLAGLRGLIKQADPDVVEEWKWDVPVWSHDGVICTGEAYEKVVKLTLAKGGAV